MILQKQTRQLPRGILVSHLLAAVVAFGAGRYWGPQILQSSSSSSSSLPSNLNCEAVSCQERNSNHGDSLSSIGNKQGSSIDVSDDGFLSVSTLSRRSVEDELLTGVPWIDDTDSSSTSTSALDDDDVVVLRPKTTSKCHRVDLVWLEESPAQHDDLVDECLAILPCTERGKDCPSDEWLLHLYRMAPAPQKRVVGKEEFNVESEWHVVPWAWQPSRSRSEKQQKPFRLETPPKPILLRESWLALQRYYLEQLPHLLQILKPLAAQAYDKNASSSASSSSSFVTILLSNKGHVDLLVNFVCAWESLPKSKHASSLNQIVVFAVDQETAAVASQLGLKVFYSPDWLGGIQGSDNDVAVAAVASYGTHEYARLMLAKIFCAHMMSMLGYDFVFHDVDIVPLRPDYLSPLVSKSSTTTSAEYDMYFQYDFAGIGSPQQVQPEYRPWFINSGLYFVRSNARTRAFFDAFVRHADLVLRSKSHQAVMTMLIDDHVSSRGLRVKVLRERADLIPGGYHFHKKWDFMHAMLNGTVHPFLFHMNYNENKETKRKFNQQIGTWFLKESCENNNLSLGQSSSISKTACCKAHPSPTCHFRDKPSKNPCRESPVVEGGQSFW